MFSPLDIRPTRSEDKRAIAELFSMPGLRYRGTAEFGKPVGLTETVLVEVVAVSGTELLGYAGPRCKSDYEWYRGHDGSALRRSRHANAIRERLT
jgi:hypothetical protein